MILNLCIILTIHLSENRCNSSYCYLAFASKHHANSFKSLLFEYHPSLYQVKVAKNGLILIGFFIVCRPFACNYWLNGTGWCLSAKVTWRTQFILFEYCMLLYKMRSLHCKVQIYKYLPEDCVSFSIMGIVPIPMPRIPGFVCFFVCLFQQSMQYTLY